MKTTIWIKLEVEGPDADKALDAVEVLLDQGTPQDQLNDDFGYDLRVINAEAFEGKKP